MAWLTPARDRGRIRHGRWRTRAWPSIQFSVIGEAWRLYKRHWFVWSLAMLDRDDLLFGRAPAACSPYSSVGHVSGHGGFRAVPHARGLVARRSLISTVVSSFFLGGMIRMANNQLRGRVPRIEDLFSVTDVWFDLMLVALLYGVAVSLGFMLCSIPGFVVSGLFMLAMPLVVEGRLPATARSFRAGIPEVAVACGHIFSLSLGRGGSRGRSCVVWLFFRGRFTALRFPFFTGDFFGVFGLGS